GRCHVKPTVVMVDVDMTLCDTSRLAGWSRVTRAELMACPPIPQGLEFCRRHHDAGHRLLIVTARSAELKSVTAHWLQWNLLLPFVGPFPRRAGVPTTL